MPPDRRPALLLTNKKSGGADSNLAPAIARLEEGGFTVTHETPDSVDDLRGRIRGSGPATVILGGGDGTLNAAAPALRDIERPFGLLPQIGRAHV